MERSEFLQKVKFITKFGRVLHAVGSPAHTLESTMVDMCKQMGIKGNVVAFPTAIFSSFSYGDEEVAKIHRVEPRGVDLGKLSQVDLVARQVSEGQLSFEDGSEKLDHILSGPGSYGQRVRVLSFLSYAACFLVIFGGSWGDLIASSIVGVLMGFLALIQPTDRAEQLFEALAAIVAATATGILSQLIPGLHTGVIILSCLIIYMPGLYITIAIAEIATQNLTSGTSRLMGGVMILLKLTFGVFIGNKIASWIQLPASHIHFATIPEWFSYLILPLTAILSNVLFNTEKKDWKWVTFAGIFGYTCGKVGHELLGAELGIFFAGACVGSAANLFARLLDRPSSIFQFPGMILLVPGSVGYRSLSFLFEQNVVSGLSTAFTMITLAMSLVVGVFLGNMLIRPRRSL